MKKNRANAEPGGEAKHQQCLTLSARKIKRVKAMVKAHNVVAGVHTRRLRLRPVSQELKQSDEEFAL